MARLKFGVFMAPFHTPGDNPNLALHRDLELIERLDQLGYDEAWVGEHHSTGWETIAPPELFLAAAAERTRRITLATGAVSLPYHHPLMVADRIVLLDHLTRGRLRFGVGPGGHLSDALMLGLAPATLRPRMAEAIEVIVRLFTETEPFSVTSDWFEMHDAVLQLRPYSDPYPPLSFTSMESPAGMQLAGQYGAGVLSLAVAKGPRGPIDLAAHWRIAEETAAEHGQTVDRADWRLAVPIYVAETRREAIEDVRAGAGAYLLDYAQAVTGREPAVAGPREAIVDQMVEAGSWVIGTPDDAVVAIRRLQERSGGFGGVLIWANEWTTREKILRSYELIARHVVPHFDGSLDGIFASETVAKAKSAQMNLERQSAVEKAQQRFEDSRSG